MPNRPGQRHGKVKGCPASGYGACPIIPCNECRVPGSRFRFFLFPATGYRLPFAAFCNASVTGGYRPAWFCGDQAKAASAPPHSTGCRVLRRHAKLENALAVACPLECGGEDAALVCPGRSIARCGGLRSEPTPCNWALPRNPDYALTNARPYVRMLRTVNDPTIGPGFRASFRVIDEGK